MRSTSQSTASQRAVPAPAAGTPSDSALGAVRDARRVLRWAHVGRLVVATAIFVAAQWAGDAATRAATQLSALVFAAAVIWTGLAIFRTEMRGHAPRHPFLGGQVAVDLLLATLIVHVTGGAASQFGALYLLVIACAGLLLPFGTAMATAVGGCALYAADVLWLRAPSSPAAVGGALWLQLGVFAAAAFGSAYVAGRLREAGAGGERLAAALAQARVEAADILRNIRSGIITVDAGGRLLYANPAASTLLGVDLDARLGRLVLLDVRGIAPELADALAQATRQGRRTTRAEGTIARPGDVAATIGVTTTVSDGVDGGHTATAIFSDITDSKRIDALNLRAERLEAVAELAASLAHEIRNPLASIRSAVEQLGTLAARATAAPIAPDEAADVRTLAALTVRESDRLSRLLGEFLDFARVRVTNVERLDVGDAVHRAVRLAVAHPDASAVDVDVDLASTPLAVAGDEELLHRALFNVVLNAVQFGVSHVRVEVAAPSADALPNGLAFADGAVAVHVTDDGAGIPPELVGRLFDPFFTTRAGGSGLGLAVVQRAVEAHGGVVLVDAGGGGRGARFTLVLPRAAADPSAALGAPASFRTTPPVPLRAVA